MSKKILLVFDFDGVIVNTFDMCLKLTQMYDPECTADEYRALMTGNIYETLALKVRNKEAREKFDFFSYYSPQVLELPLVNDIKATLEIPNTKKVIVSSTTSEPIRKYLEKHNLSGYFEQILGSDIEKSKVIKLQQVLNEYPDLKPVFITDTLGDILEARKVGIQSIAVTWGYHKEEMLKTGKPLAIVHSVEELLQAIKTFSI